MIVGAGMAGLAAARVLHAAGRAVTVLDKGRKPGGRLSTRREGAIRFNHGCQHFTVRDEGFAALMRDLGAVPWAAAGAERYVGVPDMASLAETMAGSLPDVRIEAQVSRLAREAEGWRVTLADGGVHMFGAVALAIPPIQAAELLAPTGHEFAGRLAAAHLAPCWTVMLRFDGAVAGPDVMRLAEGPLAWIARENSRPGASESPVCYTIQAGPGWSTAHLEDDAAHVITALTAAFADATGIAAAPDAAKAHRWRYALADKPLGAPCLWDAQAKLGLCGDWCLAGRLEAAFLSGAALGISMAHEL